MKKRVDETYWDQVSWFILLIASGIALSSFVLTIDHISNHGKIEWTPVHHQTVQFDSNPIRIKRNIIQTIGDSSGIKLPFAFPRRVKIEAEIAFTTNHSLSCWISDNTGTPLTGSQNHVDEEKQTSIVLRGWVDWDPKNPSTYHIKCKEYRWDPYRDDDTYLTIHSYNVVATPFLK